ncbi:hypothetical protein HY251_05730 [bacterium]|nr:hypothetical protein [bacterium]
MTLKDSGLVIIGVTDEAKQKADDFVKEKRLSYTILSSSKVKGAYGVQTPPALFLIAASGRVALEGNMMVNARLLEPYLKNVVSVDVPYANYSKKFDSVRRTLRWGDWKGASGELARLAKEPGEDGENAQKLQKWIDETGAKKLAAADAAQEAGDFFSARDAYSELERRFLPTADYATKGKDKLALLKKDEVAKKAFACEKEYGEALTFDEAGDGAHAARLYRQCGAMCAGTRFADWCEKRATRAETGAKSAPPAGGVVDK